MAEEMGFVIPFKNAQETTNLFVKQDAEMTAAGKTPVSWNFTTMPSGGGKTAGQRPDRVCRRHRRLNGVVTALVDGWATEYQMANAG